MRLESLRMTTLRYLRIQHHLTQEQFAVAADVSPSTVYHSEAGKVRPRPSIVRRLARALAVHSDDIDADGYHVTAASTNDTLRDDGPPTS